MDGTEAARESGGPVRDIFADVAGVIASRSARDREFFAGLKELLDAVRALREVDTKTRRDITASGGPVREIFADAAGVIAGRSALDQEFIEGLNEVLGAVRALRLDESKTRRDLLDIGKEIVALKDKL